MILYLDTSAFLKLYLEEEGSPAIRKRGDDAAGVCTHLITYAEMCAALAQAVRMERLTEAERVVHKARFDADWKAMHVLLVDQALVHRAGALAEKLALANYGDRIRIAGSQRCVFSKPGRAASPLSSFRNRASDIRNLPGTGTLPALAAHPDQFRIFALRAE